MSRLYPEQYSSSVRKVLEEVSFGPPVLMVSSGDPKVMYAADYDLLEKVMYNGIKTVRAFQKKIELLASKYKITDIKCGENLNWNLLQTKIYNKQKELEHLRRLWKEKVISDNELQEGELVFFNTRGGVSHVGVYLFNDYFVHASVKNGVTINNLNEAYYKKKYIGSGRVKTSKDLFSSLFDRTLLKISSQEIGTIPYRDIFKNIIDF
jgi:hypothetical protein